MSQEKYDIFISYSRKDTAIADQICAALDSVGITYFIDRQGIGGGFEFPAVLAENIVNSKLFLLLASKNSYESKFTMSEIVFAFNKKPKNAILPYIIDNSSLPISLEFVFAGINWRNMTDHPIDPTLVDDLLKMLGRKRVKKVVEEVKAVTETTPHLTEREKYLLSLPDEEFVSFEGNGSYGYKLKSTGEVVIPLKYTDVCSFFEGLAWVKLNGKYGYINKTGDEIIPLKYDGVGSFSEGLSMVSLDGKYGFIDKTGKEIIPLRYDWARFFSEGLAMIKLDGKCGFIDKIGEIVISLKYDYAESFSEGLAMVKLDGKCGFIDKIGNLVISLKYDWADDFSEGMAQVRMGSFSNGKYGFIDKVGKEIIPFKYDWVSCFSNGKAKVELNGEHFFIDKNGNKIK